MPSHELIETIQNPGLPATFWPKASEAKNELGGGGGGSTHLVARSGGGPIGVG